MIDIESFKSYKFNYHWVVLSIDALIDLQFWYDTTYRSPYIHIRTHYQYLIVIHVQQ